MIVGIGLLAVKKSLRGWLRESGRWRGKWGLFRGGFLLWRRTRFNRLYKLKQIMSKSSKNKKIKNSNIKSKIQS
jgi:hypothetical protein